MLLPPYDLLAMTPTSHFTSLHADPYPADAADQVQKPVVFFE